MGSFLVKNNRPYFSPDGKKELEIKTEEGEGSRIEVKNIPTELQPNRYYNFGKVTTKISILRLVSNTTEFVETYSGEFTIGKGGEVKLPAAIRWVEKPEFSEEGYTYQFEIKNGIGKFVKVQS